MNNGYSFAFGNLSSEEFNQRALDLFKLQSEHNAVYKAYLRGIKVNPAAVWRVEDIPFLPVSLFKTHDVLLDGLKPNVVFTSSGTTGMQQSRHLVSNIEVYRQSFTQGFNYFYGNVENYCILGLLPSYLEREGSSLIFMVEELIKKTNNPHSGLFLHNYEELHRRLLSLEAQKQKTLLIGVSYALLDFSEKYPMRLSHTTVIETGGMKGKRKEMLREELHQVLRGRLGIGAVHSEYGMTELLSQAYMLDDGRFHCPPWLQVFIRDVNDPLSLVENDKTGGINLIDLANINSCSFIAVQDLGRKYEDGTFEILGRFDNSDIRGCNLLVQ